MTSARPLWILILLVGILSACDAKWQVSKSSSRSGSEKSAEQPVPEVTEPDGEPAGNEPDVDPPDTEPEINLDDIVAGLLAQPVTAGQTKLTWDKDFGGGSIDVRIANDDLCTDLIYESSNIAISKGEHDLPWLADGEYHVCLSAQLDSGATKSVNTPMTVNRFPIFFDQAGTNIAGQIGFNDANELVIVGSFSGEVDFGRGRGDFLLTSAGGSDLFVVRMTIFGETLSAERFGGTGNETVSEVDFAPNGAAVIQGKFDADWTLPAVGSLTLSDADADYFVMTLDEEQAPKWIHSFPFDGSLPSLNDVVIYSDGTVYAGFRYQGTYDFDPTANTDSQSSSGYNDGFLTKLNADGTYGWTKRFSGAGSDGEMGQIAMRADGSLVFATSTKGGADADPGAGTVTMTAHGGSDAFYTILNPDGTYANSSGIVGGSAYDYANAVSYTGTDVLLAGHSASTNLDIDPTSAGSQVLADPGTGWDLFAARFDSAGQVVWAHSWGADGDQFNWHVNAAIPDYLFIRGTYTDPFDVDFDTDKIVSLEHSGSHDAFFTVIDKEGSHVGTWSISSTGGGDNIYSVAVDHDGKVWLHGFADQDSDLKDFGEGVFRGQFIVPLGLSIPAGDQ